jgi:hypothetical protein
MLNEMVPFELPGGLDMRVKALSIKQMRQLSDAIQIAWPIDAQIIALTEPLPDGGFDIDAIRRMMVETTEQEITRRDVAISIGSLGNALGDPATDRLSAIADVLLMLADTSAPVPSKEVVVAALEEGTAPQIVDMLRFVWSVSGGFPGDLRSRFDLP